MPWGDVGRQQLLSHTELARLCPCLCWVASVTLPVTKVHSLGGEGGALEYMSYICIYYEINIK